MRTVQDAGLQSRFRTSRILSAIIVLLAALASVGGLVMDDLYRDNTFVRTVYRSNDLVTLAVALPLLIASLITARRGSCRAYLVWLGVLDYMLYNYAFYLFGARFNRFFLLYVLLFTLTIFALIFALGKTDAKAISRGFRPQTPLRWIGGYMLFVALGLSGVYLAQSISFIATGELPSIVTLSGHPTSIVFALDLSLLVPWLLLGAVWLWRRRPWGYVIAAIMNVKGGLYTLVLAVGSMAAARAGVTGASAETPLWIALTVAGTIASFFLLWNLRRADA